MEKLQMHSFQVIGISVRTTNQDEKSKKDIGELWGRFMSQNMFEKIPNITDETIYAVYTEYEGDHTQPYTTIIGYRVHSLDKIPEGLVGITIEPATYHKFIAKGDLTDTAVISKWGEICAMNIQRTYTTDFEMYGIKAADPTNGEADIYIAIQ